MRALAVAALLAAACGDDGAQTDAPVNVPDAPTDAAAMPDGGPLPPDLNACDDDHPCPAGVDCIRITWLGGARRCARKCQATADCGLDEICYVHVSNPSFGSMAQHCWLSYCTTPLAACTLGAEVGLEAAEQRPGTCLPLDDAAADATDGGVPGPIGQCLEAGSVGEDLPCLLVNRQRGGDVCIQGMVCTGDSTDVVGRCQRLCNPLASADPCSAKACFDNSQGTTVRDPQSGQVLAQIRATWGFCRNGTRCSLVAPGGVCPAGTGCFPTNPVRPNGFCSFRGDGLRSVGQSCVPFGTVAPALDERCREAYCDPAVSDGALAGVCRAFCDQAHTCQAGSCVPYSWSETGNLTQDFGVCR